MTTTHAVMLAMGGICGAVMSLFGVLGIVWKVALPWLREQLARPVAEIKEQVANTHSTNLRSDLDVLRDLILAVDAKASRIGIQLDAHLLTAAGIDASTQARLIRLEERDRTP